MLGALFEFAQGIEFEARFNSERFPETRDHREKLDIDVGTGKTEGFAAELMELPVAAALRALVPEHRPEVPEALRGVVGEAVLNGAAHDGARIFRTQGEFFTVHAVFKGIHFLFDNIGHFPDTAGKKRRLLKNRRADLTKTVERRRTAGRIGEKLPYSAFFGEHVGHPLDAGDLNLCHFALSFNSFCRTSASRRSPQSSV